MLNLDPDSIKWSIKSILKYGDTDVFPKSFEYDAINDNIDFIIDYLSSQNILEWYVRPHRSLLAPKARYGFRIVTQLDPLDTIIFLSLVKEIGADLESKRVSIDKDIVFSYRYSPNREGRMYDNSVGYAGFQKKTRELIDSYNYIGSADIADFYHRIYIHRLENALQISTSKNNHVKSIIHLISGWNETESYGIPVGNAASRLLAEITLKDIDEALLTCSIPFIRYSDDYRIFGQSKSEVYRDISILADYLYRNHGLTLQPQKTYIYDSATYKSLFLTTGEELEINSLNERFSDLIEELGIDDWYEDIEYDDLSPEQKNIIDSLNLVEIYRSTVKSNDIDYAILRFVLRRLGQLGDESLVDDIFHDIDKIYPVFQDIIKYFISLRDISYDYRKEIGKRVLNLINDSIVSELEYHKMWAMSIFTYSTEWDNEDEFHKILTTTPSQFVRRKAILAMGRASKTHWFQSRWRHLFDESPWTRRALIAGASCLAADARKHLYNSIESRLDKLEYVVMKWAKQNPFRE
jgi:hypothetical protein